MKVRVSTLAAILYLLGTAIPLSAQSSAAASSAQQEEVIRLWPGKAPGNWNVTGQEVSYDLNASPGAPPVKVISNISDPTMTVFRPAPGKATGSAMVVLPGGAFVMLAMQHEGYDVARWLADRGITAFVVKYRVRPLEMPYADWVKDPAPYTTAFDKYLDFIEPNLTIAAADTHQAIRLVRRDAAKYGVDPSKIGVMGFSAGGITTIRAVESAEGDAKPNFAASIYGASLKPPVSPAGTPLFLAHAQDDSTVPAQKSLVIYEAWKKAGNPVEMHIFETGGHGFGVQKLNRQSDNWTASFEPWLRSHGYIAKSEAK